MNDMNIFHSFSTGGHSVQISKFIGVSKRREWRHNIDITQVYYIRESRRVSIRVTDADAGIVAGSFAFASLLGAQRRLEDHQGAERWRDGIMERETGLACTDLGKFA